MKRALLLLIPALLLAAPDGDLTPKQMERKKRSEERALRKQERIDQGRLLVSPYVGPGYTPELGGLIAMGGLFSFKTNPSDSLIQRSSIPLNLTLTSTGGWMTNTTINTYWFGDRLRIDGDFWYKDMPDHYWGIGYHKGSSVEKSDSTTAYDRQWFWLNPRIMWQPVNNYFAGVNLNYTYQHSSNPSAGVAADSNFAEFNDKPLNSGLGFILRYDSRDIPVDARQGVFVDLTGTFYGEYLGGDNKFQSYLIDYRQYQQVGREGRTLAWQLKGRFTFGDVPYAEMSQVGTPFDLRGYLWGQYRDYHMGFAMAEYRHIFKKETGELSKHGIVTWLASGSVFDTDDMRSNTIYSLPNLGVGYRFELQPRMHLRMDLGIGRETSGFYFNFNQAF